MSAETGAIPSRWLRITGMFSAEAHLVLLKEVNARGIDVHDYDQVEIVWKELNAKAEAEADELKKRAEAREKEAQADQERKRKLGTTFPGTRKRL